jgi:hypothetical protein
MRWFPRNVSVPGTNAEEISESPDVIHRTEITVERKVCTVEIHGSVQLAELTRCPVCGQRLAAEQSHLRAALEREVAANGPEKPG